MGILKCEGSKHRHPNRNKGTARKDEQPRQLQGPAVPRRCLETQTHLRPLAGSIPLPRAAAHPAPSRSKGCKVVGSGQQFWSCFLRATSAPRQRFALQQQHGVVSRALQTCGTRTAQELPSPLPTPCAVHQAETGDSKDGE